MKKRASSSSSRTSVSKSGLNDLNNLTVSYCTFLSVMPSENSRFFAFYYDACEELSRRYGVRFRAAMETNYGQHRILADFDRVMLEYYRVLNNATHWPRRT